MEKTDVKTVMDAEDKKTVRNAYTVKIKRSYGGPGVLRQCCKLKKCVITSKRRVAKQKTKLSAAPLATNLSATSTKISVATSISLVSSTSAPLTSVPTAPTISAPSRAIVSAQPLKTISPPRKRIKRAVLVSPPPLRSSRRRPALPSLID